MKKRPNVSDEKYKLSNDFECIKFHPSGYLADINKHIDQVEAELKEVREKNRQLHGLLGECSCPHCNGSGGIQISEDEVEQCQWCSIKNQIEK